MLQNGTARHFNQPVRPLPPAISATPGAPPAKNGMDWPISDTRYVWLPIRFDKNHRPMIEWYREWSLDEFE